MPPSLSRLFPTATPLGRAIAAIAATNCAGSIAVTSWVPLLPLYMLHVGAKGDSEALAWVAAGFAAQGVGRLLGGPIWGVIADRYGRKKMFVRALYSTVLSTAFLGIIQAPWQLSIALGLHGLLAGLSPAAVALTSVVVPDAKLRSAMGWVTGAQYLGSTLGPGVGASLAVAIGFRGSMLISALLVAVVATVAVFYLPDERGRSSAHATQDTSAKALVPFRPTLQFALAILVYFMLFSIGGMRTVAVPMALKQITGTDVTSTVGIAFSLAGLASVLGVLLTGDRFLKKRPLRSTLAIACALLAASHLFLASSNLQWTFVAGLAVAALLNAAMLPVTTTLIALNVSRERRGTAFGVASGAQAIGIIAGPFAAAVFAASSIQMGFLATTVLLGALAALIALAVREPQR